MQALANTTSEITGFPPAVNKSVDVVTGGVVRGGVVTGGVVTVAWSRVAW